MGTPQKKASGCRAACRSSVRLARSCPQTTAPQGDPRQPTRPEPHARRPWTPPGCSLWPGRCMCRTALAFRWHGGRATCQRPNVSNLSQACVQCLAHRPRPACQCSARLRPIVSSCSDFAGRFRLLHLGCRAACHSSVRSALLCSQTTAPAVFSQAPLSLTSGVESLPYARRLLVVVPSFRCPRRHAGFFARRPRAPWLCSARPRPILC
jgi:hypothetical protein